MADDAKRSSWDRQGRPQPAADRLGEFDKPALIAWSREDKLFKPAHAERLAADLPNARVEWIDDACTFSMEDNPARWPS